MSNVKPDTEDFFIDLPEQTRLLFVHLHKAGDCYDSNGASQFAMNLLGPNPLGLSPKVHLEKFNRMA